tara:strand:- start:469 stop:1014 length:546 start_codon:yes stop_codon:yes gene_type:complete
MIQILQNSQSENYKLLKKNILGQYFPWYYYDHTTDAADERDGHKNIPDFGHTFISRPEEFGWSKHDSTMHQLAVDVVREILFENKFYPEENFILRLATNCTLPSRGAQFSLPHVDHHFPHLNFITYLTNSGGSTFIEGVEHKPKEDQTILFTGEHYLQLPQKERRIVLVATIMSITNNFDA